MSEVQVGTSGWHYDSWRGPFYPTSLKTKDFLSFYAERFTSTEINNSFYRLPSAQAIRACHDATPEGFLFAWKVSRLITHLKRLKDVDENLAFVFARMQGLGGKFGPALFQLPPFLKANVEQRDRLARCLELLPTGRRYAFEFRHPSWYEAPVLDLLRDHDAALCLSDHASAPAPRLVTASFVYVRAHGPGGRYAGHYGDDTLRDWARSMAQWRAGDAASMRISTTMSAALPRPMPYDSSPSCVEEADHSIVSTMSSRCTISARPG